jgi:serine/threonine protein kinase
MTEVFEVDDNGIRKVIKILKDNFPDAIDRFQREFLTLRNLNHPGIPKVEAGAYFTITLNPQIDRSLPPIHCYVMEKITGQTLEDFISNHGKISGKQAIPWLRQLLEILDAIHHHPTPLFHRDIKPSNIILKPNGQLVLIDFGTARGITDTYVQKYNLGQITAVISGGYTPQEQIDGKALPQSDFFALGRTFVHLLTGKHPTELPRNDHTGQLIWRDCVPQIPPPLADFIDELMDLSPGNRLQNAIVGVQILNHLRWRQFQRFLKSPRFKIIVAILLVSVVIYRLSFPWISRYYYDQGVAAYRANQIDRARQFYEKALDFNTQDSRIYNDLGNICRDLNDKLCAEQNYQKSLEIDPGNSVANYNLGSLYEDQGQWDRAVAEYQKAMNSHRPVATNAISNLARIHILQGDTTKAIELSQQGLQKAKNDRLKSTLYRNLGWAYWIQADYPQAEENLQKALRLQPKWTDAYCLFAQVREAQNRQREALQFWKDCRDGNAENRVEILIWKTMARQRLQEARTKPIVTAVFADRMRTDIVIPTIATTGLKKSSDISLLEAYHQQIELWQWYERNAKSFTDFEGRLSPTKETND